MSSDDGRPPVADWATDYDIFDGRYIREPEPIWDDLRQRCPVAHTERWGGSWLPTRYEDIRALARMVPELSSVEPLVVKPPPLPNGEYAGVVAPPISIDPPEHGPARRLILPAFSPQAVASHEPFTRELAHRLIDVFAGRGRADAATEYAQQIPPRVIAHLLGVDPAQADTFVLWARGLLEQGLTDPEIRWEARRNILGFFSEQVAQRRAEPRDDFISDLLAGDLDGRPVPDDHVIGTCFLLLVAGIDTTWSSIGSALWHLASVPSDRKRLVAEPEVIPTAVEELLRAYSPVTMGRVVTEEVEFNGVTLSPGDRVLLNFPGANRDPEAFPDADQVIIDRRHNRHIAFGVGIHRCAGSNLARMEMNVALSVFLERIPEFSLEDPAAVTWAGGQVRGPRRLPIVFPVP
ncbi:MAG: cytochrome P450 [Actinomycetota bacterium]|nr:cytochrome P450 [Actinomycetota bacterium]